MSIKELLAERQKTHGDFVETARIAQHVKEFYRSCLGWSRLSLTQREAIEAETLKNARLLSGDPNFKEHWVDKAGYATLGANDCGVDAPPFPAHTHRKFNVLPYP